MTSLQSTTFTFLPERMFRSTTQPRRISFRGRGAGRSQFPTLPQENTRFTSTISSLPIITSSNRSRFSSMAPVLPMTKLRLCSSAIVQPNQSRTSNSRMALEIYWIPQSTRSPNWHRHSRRFCGLTAKNTLRLRFPWRRRLSRRPMRAHFTMATLMH